MSDWNPKIILLEKHEALMREKDAEIERLRGTLQWLDRWIGEKSLLECANKIREALGDKP